MSLRNASNALTMLPFAPKASSSSLWSLKPFRPFTGGGGLGVAFEYGLSYWPGCDCQAMAGSKTSSRPNRLS